MKWTVDGVEIEFDETEPRRQPDWDNRSSLSGGHLKDVPTPFVREYPGPRRRPVQIDFHFYSVGIHWSATVREDRNQLWNPLTKAEAHPNQSEIQDSEYGQEITGWQSPWDDDSDYAKGRVFYSPRSLSLTRVQTWARLKLEAEFSDTGIYVVVMAHGDLFDLGLKWLKGGKYIYYTEGD